MAAQDWEDGEGHLEAWGTALGLGGRGEAHQGDSGGREDGGGTGNDRNDWGTGRWDMGGSGDDWGSHKGRERSGEVPRASRDTGCTRSGATGDGKIEGEPTRTGTPGAIASGMGGWRRGLGEWGRGLARQGDREGDGQSGQGHWEDEGGDWGGDWDAQGLVMGMGGRRWGLGGPGLRTGMTGQ